MSRERVAEIQRGRILAAMAEAAAEVGYARLTIAAVLGRARVSRKTFYDMFADREDCFFALFERTVAEAGLVACEAYGEADSWRDGMRLALARLLGLMDDERGLARVCLVEALAAGERVQARRTCVLGELAGVVDRGRLSGGPSREPPQLTAEGVVGAVVTVLYNRLLQRDEKPLIDLLGPLMSIIVLPYHGPSAAKRELRRPAPRAVRGGAGRARVDSPLEGLNMRLTHRTVRVLAVIAEHPGASNREVAEDSGVMDQGQISKLLKRLAGQGLVENRGEGQKKGGANAWHLTANGSQMEQATRPTLKPARLAPCPSSRHAPRSSGRTLSEAPP